MPVAIVALVGVMLTSAMHVSIVLPSADVRADVRRAYYYSSIVAIGQSS
jgi:hypothetical protein